MTLIKLPIPQPEQEPVIRAAAISIITVSPEPEAQSKSEKEKTPEQTTKLKQKRGHSLQSAVEKRILKMKQLIIEALREEIEEDVQLMLQSQAEGLKVILRKKRGNQTEIKIDTEKTHNKKLESMQNQIDNIEKSNTARFDQILTLLAL
jgi:hypothetical protein